MTPLWTEQWNTLPNSARRSLRKLVFSSPSKTDLRQRRPVSSVLETIDHTDKQPVNVISNNTTTNNNKNQQTTAPRRPQIYGPPKARNRPISGNASLIPSNRVDSIYLSQTFFATPLSKMELCDDPSLVTSPKISLADALSSGGIQRQRGFFSRARLSNIWLDLGRSLMEQGIYHSPLNLDDDYLDSTVETEGKENGVNESEIGNKIPLLRLRFKYNAFYDLTRKSNAVRINQLFEQARWSIVSEAIECTNDEAALFAALHLQVSLQINNNNSFYFLS